MIPLFRHQAVSAVSRSEFGTPVALIPRSWWLLFGFLLVFSVCTIAFLATATFPRKESAAGVLRHSLGEIRIAAPRSGIVRALYVADRQAVKAGDPLVFITTEQRLADGEVYDARVLAALERERLTLERRLAALDASQPLQERALRQHIQGIEEQLVQLDASRISKIQQTALATQSADGGELLARQGALPIEQARTRRQTALMAQQAVADVMGQIASLKSQSLEATLQLAHLPADIEQTRASILTAIEALEEKRAAAAAQNGFTLVAQTDGVVTALQIRAGQPVDTVKPLLAIIPDGSQLRAELYVPSRAIGFVKEGQVVRLLYDAFPYTRFGPGFGTIVELTTTVLAPSEVSAAINVTEPVYRVVANLRDNAMMAYGQQVPLQSGMALTADILLENRSFLEMLFDPLLAARGRVLGGAS